MKYIKLFESNMKEEIESYLIDLRDELDGARSMFDVNSKIEVIEYKNHFEVSYPRHIVFGHQSVSGGTAIIQKDPFEITRIIEEFKNRIEYLGYKSEVEVKFANMGSGSRYPDDVSFSFKILFHKI